MVKYARSPEAVIRNIAELFDLGTLVGTADLPIGGQGSNGNKVSGGVSHGIQATRALRDAVYQIRPAGPIVFIGSALPIRRSVREAASPVEVSIQRQSANNSICPARNTGAKLLAAAQGQGVIAKEFEVVAAVDSQSGPIRRED